MQILSTASVALSGVPPEILSRLEVTSSSKFSTTSILLASSFECLFQSDPELILSIKCFFISLVAACTFSGSPNHVINHVPMYRCIDIPAIPNIGSFSGDGLMIYVFVFC